MQIRPYILQRAGDYVAEGVPRVPLVRYEELNRHLGYASLCWFYDHYLPGWLPSRLSCTGKELFITAEEVARQGQFDPEGRVWWEDLQRKFAEDGYVVIPKLLTPGYAKSVAQVFNSLQQDRWNDMKGIRRTSLNNLPIMRLLHMQLERMISYVVQTPVIASYSFTAKYETGSILPRHTDRPQCKYNISLMLDSEPSPDLLPEWPLNLEIKGQTKSVGLGAGDAVLYSGISDPHWRDPMPDPLVTVTGAFLHYVDPNFPGALD